MVKTWKIPLIILAGEGTIAIALIQLTKKPTPPIPVELLTYLNYNLIHRRDITWTVDSYDILNIPIPNRLQIIGEFNNTQNSDGTWGSVGYGLYATSQIIMFYSRSGVKPPKPLDPFYSTIDTWEKVESFVRQYGDTNYWGFLYLIVNIWIVDKGVAPPWVNKFLEKVNTDFGSWAYDNHQRTHLIGNLMSLRQAIPRLDEVVTITLQQQKADGSWDSGEFETAVSTQVLSLLRSQTTVNKGLIDSAIAKGVEYIKQCYKKVLYEGVIYGGYASNPSLTNPTARETALGISVLLRPENNVWLRWFV